MLERLLPSRLWQWYSGQEPRGVACTETGCDWSSALDRSTNYGRMQRADGRCVIGLLLLAKKTTCMAETLGTLRRTWDRHLRSMDLDSASKSPASWTLSTFNLTFGDWNKTHCWRLTEQYLVCIHPACSENKGGSRTKILHLLTKTSCFWCTYYLIWFEYKTRPGRFFRYSFHGATVSSLRILSIDVVMNRLPRRQVKTGHSPV